MDEAVLSLAILGNVCNFAYNVPFVYVVVKHNSADNISMKFLYLRLLGSVIWIMYAIFTTELFVGISYTITLLSSSIVFYVKINERKREIEPNPLEIMRETAV